MVVGKSAAAFQGICDRRSRPAREGWPAGRPQGMASVSAATHLPFADVGGWPSRNRQNQKLFPTAVQSWEGPRSEGNPDDAKGLSLVTVSHVLGPTMPSVGNPPKPGPKQQPAGREARQPEPGRATEGYWLHDTAGPKKYVGSAQPDIEDIRNRFAVRLAALKDAPRGVVLSLVDGNVILEGEVTSGQQVVDLQNLAVEVAGEANVVNQLSVVSAEFPDRTRSEKN